MRRNGEELAELLAGTDHGDRLPLFTVAGLLGGFTTVPSLAPDIVEAVFRTGLYAADHLISDELREALTIIHQLPADRAAEWSPGIKSALRMTDEVGQLAREFGKEPTYFRSAFEGLCGALRERAGFGAALTDGDVFLLEHVVSLYLKALETDDFWRFEQVERLAVIASRLHLETKDRAHPFDLGPLVEFITSRIADLESWETVRDLNETQELNGKGDFDRALIARRRERFSYETLLIDLGLTVGAAVPEAFDRELWQKHLATYRYLGISTVLPEAELPAEWKERSIARFQGVLIDLERVTPRMFRDDVHEFGWFVRATHDLIGQLIDAEGQGGIPGRHSAADTVGELLADAPASEQQTIRHMFEQFRQFELSRSLCPTASTARAARQDEVPDFEASREVDPRTALAELRQQVEEHGSVREEHFWECGGASAIAALADPEYALQARAVFRDFIRAQFTNDAVSSVLKNLPAVAKVAGTGACGEFLTILGECLRRPEVTGHLRIWQNYFLTRPMPAPFLAQLLSASHEPLRDPAAVLEGLADNSRGTYEELQGRRWWGLAANRLAWTVLTPEERGTLLPEPICEELRRSATALKERLTREMRERITAQTKWDRE